MVAFIYGANTWGNMATEVVKYYLMLHYQLPSGSAVLQRSVNRYGPIDPRVPGYTQSWEWRTTNYYGSPNRD